MEHGVKPISYTISDVFKPHSRLSCWFICRINTRKMH